MRLTLFLLLIGVALIAFAIFSKGKEGHRKKEIEAPAKAPNADQKKNELPKKETVPTHDKPAIPPRGLDKHLELNQKFPELKDTSHHHLTVPLLFRIAEDGTLYDIRVNKNYINRDPKRKLIYEPEFEKEAIRLLKSSGKWQPATHHGAYVNIENTYLIRFDIHPVYFENNDDPIALNPDTKASFIGDQSLYQSYTAPKNGCDGMVSFLAIVEKDGNFSNPYAYNIVGKTNERIGLSYLNKLVPWEPAKKDGQPVRSQIKITIETQ